MTSSRSRLAAVLFADIVGYSDLTARDEARAMKLVRAFHRASRSSVSRFGGRVVKFMGDGVLAEFPSTRAAVGAAAALREAFERRASEEDLGEVALRSGIHAGDVVTSEGDILGDGVNTAARLHEVAEPGEILVSDAVYLQLRQRREIEFEPRGERELKGVGRVKVYAATPSGTIELEPAERRNGDGTSARRVVAAAVAAAVVIAVVAGGFLLGGRSGEEIDRSIAVLPFETIGENADPTFTEGIHGDVLTRLSTVSGLEVISRNSVIRYREPERSLDEIARELDVAWVLQGEVQQVGDRVQVNARLVDAREDRQVWAQDYRRDLTAENLFEIQHEITLEIIAALEAHLTREERLAIESTPTGNLEAYRLYVQGRGFVDQRTEDALRRGVEYLERAIDEDGGYALAWAGLADALALLEFYGYGAPEATVDPMYAARRAVELDPRSGEAHASLGIVLSLRQRGPEALAALERAVELRPAYAEAYIWLGWVQLMIGRPEEALESARRAADLNPLGPAIRAYLAEALLANGDARGALVESRRSMEMQPEYGLPRFMEGLSLHHLGRTGEGISAYSEVLRLVPPAGTPTHAEIRAALAVGHVAAGDSRSAREILDRIAAAAHPFSAGLVHAALGEEDRAFAAFARVRDWGSLSNELARYYFPDVLGPLRSGPRYRELLRRIDAAWGLEPDGSLAAGPSGR